MLKEDQSAKAHKGFLYISHYHLDAHFQPNGSTAVVSCAVNRLVLCEQLVGRWNVAAYIGEYRATSWRMAEPPSPAQRCEVAKDCRPFVRANFVEFIGHQAPDGGSLVTTKALQQLPALTQHASCRTGCTAQMRPRFRVVH